MLEELSLKNLGVIKEAVLPFAPGYTVITGESGAGKSLLLTGLGLLMGKRADAGTVRPGADSAFVEGVWAVEEDSLHHAAVSGTGADVEDGSVFVSRSVKTDGKSRASLCGRSVPAKVLGDTVGPLVSIHGQSDQLRLRTAEAQREALDRFAGEPVVRALAPYQKLYREVRALEARLADVTKNRAARQREYLQVQGFLEDFNRVEPQEGELEALSAEIDLLSHLDVLREGVGEVAGLLDGGEESFPPADALSSALRRLTSMAHHDPHLDPVVEAVKEALAALETATDELHSYGAGLDENGIERLYAAQERKQELDSFLKKHHLKLAEALAYADEATVRLAELDPEANDEEGLREELETLRAGLLTKGRVLGKARAAAAKILTARVNEELAGLAMVGVTLRVDLEEGKPGFHGLEEVTFKVLQPGGKEAQPITRAASGGELSRIMLALEVVLADPTTTPTYIFDEVDSGVGGATAIEIGRRLQRLAREGAQVIVVSHLAQVAAFGDCHLVVKKSVVKGEALTTVETLDDAGRREEITRLLSGLTGSDSGQAHADELLALGQGA